MPLSPARQRELRAKTAEPKKLPRKRCLNCAKLFEMTRQGKRFCSDACRKEFHHYGAAYGPLRDKLEALIEKRVKEQVGFLVVRLGLVEQELRKCASN